MAETKKDLWDIYFLRRESSIMGTLMLYLFIIRILIHNIKAWQKSSNIASLNMINKQRVYEQRITYSPSMKKRNIFHIPLFFLHLCFYFHDSIGAKENVTCEMTIFLQVEII